MVKPIFELNRFTILDGGMGTMLQKAGLEPGQLPELFALHAPQKLMEIHRAYVQAGADIITTNTFGASPKKLAGCGYTAEQVIEAAVACALKAAGGKAQVALDIGPLGELMEPSGTLSFEEAYAIFAQIATAGERAGAQLVMVETMTDLAEIKAAVLAVLENTRLPVLASMTFEADGRTFAGVPVEAFAATIGALGVSGLGINCSLGPSGVMPLLQRLCNASPVPVFVMPNAGLPDPITGQHSLSPENFCAEMEPCLSMGVCAVGGCCGTTPDTIARLAERFKTQVPVLRQGAQSPCVCGATEVVYLNCPVAIGERINPTGKKRLREALQMGDLAYVQTLAVEQQRAGAAILDVNVGAPGVDEVELLPKAVKAVQAVSGLPLQLDSANPKALEAALRICVGKPIVNSTSGEEEKMQAVLSLCQKYGAAVVGLTLDENGIPATAEERVAIAGKIVTTATKMGMAREDVLIDCLTLSVGAQPGAGAVTLEAVRLVHEKLGLKNVLGVSNISFGLPNRPLLNRTFLAMALQAGLDLPILNPGDEGMMGALHAFCLLKGYEQSVDTFVSRYGEQTKADPIQLSQSAQGLSLDMAIERGLKAEAITAVRALLQSRPGESMQLVNEYLIPALDRVGKGFEEKKVFLPQLLAAASAAQAAFEEMRLMMGEAQAQNGPPVVVATVQGDIHDIGKNIAKVILENYGFRVIDLGRDVPPEAVLRAARESGAKLVGLSALMTTTLPAMEATIQLLHHHLPDVKVLVGGAVLTASYAKKIGADFHAKDAVASAEYARSLHA